MIRIRLPAGVPAVVGIALMAVLIALLGGITPPIAAQTGATPTPLPLYALPSATQNRAFTSSSIALKPDDTRIAAAVNLLSSTVTFANPGLGRVIGEYPVAPDPRSVAFTDDGDRALVVSRADSVLTVFDSRAALAAEIGVDPTLTVLALDGLWAYGLVTEGDRAYVSLLGSDAVAVVDLTDYRVIATIPTPDAPAGLMLWGEFLYVSHFWSGAISLIYLPQQRVIETVATGIDTALMPAFAPDISRGIAYVPATRLNASAPALTYDSAAQAIVNLIDLRDLSGRPPARIALDLVDQPVEMPFAAALDRFAGRLYVANAASDAVSVIDLAAGLARTQIPVGANPRGLVLNADNTRLYVHNALDNTITTINTGTLAVEDTLVISSQLRVSADVLLGMQAFYSAADPRFTTDHGLACASCHFDGMSDGRVWSAFNLPTVEGVPAPRNTPLLYALPETVPYTWTGAWDELADLELKIRGWMAGTGAIDDAAYFAAGTTPAAFHTGLSPDLDGLIAYLNTLAPPPSAPPQPTAAVTRGAAVFAEQNCAACHVGTVGTNLETADVGTGGAFDTPSLRWLWLSAPYFHDGRAATLRQVFELPGAHDLVGAIPADDLDALTAYLLAWTNTPPAGD